MLSKRAAECLQLPALFSAQGEAASFPAIIGPKFIFGLPFRESTPRACSKLLFAINPALFACLTRGPPPPPLAYRAYFPHRAGSLWYTMLVVCSTFVRDINISRAALLCTETMHTHKLTEGERRGVPGDCVAAAARPRSEYRSPHASDVNQEHVCRCSGNNDNDDNSSNNISTAIVCITQLISG